MDEEKGCSVPDKQTCPETFCMSCISGWSGLSETGVVEKGNKCEHISLPMCSPFPSASIKKKTKVLFCMKLVVDLDYTDHQYCQLVTNYSN